VSSLYQGAALESVKTNSPHGGRVIFAGLSRDRGASGDHLLRMNMGEPGV
jgi:hypothetical protein